MTLIAGADRARHLAWLLELTSVPTAAGKERRVVRWIDRWVENHPGVRLERDPAGNLVLSLADSPRSDRPLFFTAHLDHPAFVVERIVSPTTVELAFRGGVMPDYFPGAGVRCLDVDGHATRGRILEHLAPPVGSPQEPFKRYLAELDCPAEDLMPGDLAVWDLPPAEVSGELVHAPACDDLAAAAAALAALDALQARRAAGEAVSDVRVLFTRAEEVGFVGAIAAVRHQTMPKGARVLALENSRSFDDSPINAGPIVRVGDRLSIFSPSLTGAVALRAAEIAGGPSQPLASQKSDSLPKWRWQRKLMAGGACEATVFCQGGYEATCLCMPLGNYHNMADLSAVQSGTHKGQPRIDREFIGVADYHGLVDLLVGCGLRLQDASPTPVRVDKVWADLGFVLDPDRPSGTPTKTETT